MKKIMIYALAALASLSSCKKKEAAIQEPGTVTYGLHAESSKLGWAGHTDQETNEGSFDLTSEGIQTKDGKITGGRIIIPISSLEVLNLEGELKDMLTAHLKSADFFNIIAHPQASFEIKSTAPFTGPVTEGMFPGSNTLIKGEFTLLGVKRNLEITAKVIFGGNLLNVIALFRINRMDYGMDYASDESQREHYIYPEVDLELVALAEKK